LGTYSDVLSMGQLWSATFDLICVIDPTRLHKIVGRLVAKREQ